MDFVDELTSDEKLIVGYGSGYLARHLPQDPAVVWNLMAAQFGAPKVKEFAVVLARRRQAEAEAAAVRNRAQADEIAALLPKKTQPEGRKHG